MQRLAYSSEPIEHGVLQFVALLLLAVPPALVLAGVTGYCMAHKALQPLDKMAQRAESITASDLDQRMPVENPNDELGRMARVLNELLQRLQNSFELLKRFTADASHELRTPLSSIRRVGEVALQRLHTPKEYRDTIGSTLEEVTRLTEMVDGLLSISRTDEGQIVLHKTMFSALGLAKEVVALLGLLAEEKGQQIQIEGDAGLSVHADRVVLHRGLAKYRGERNQIWAWREPDLHSGSKVWQLCRDLSGRPRGNNSGGSKREDLREILQDRRLSFAPGRRERSRSGHCQVGD